MISLDDSKKYMLTTENINQWYSNKIQTTKSEEKNKIKKPIIADNSDTLFWAFYSILYGDQEYEINHNFQTEKQFKIKCIDSSF